MNILMMTNTYKPLVGGVTRSVETFANEYRKRGHNVLIIAPRFENLPETEEGVIRVPAIQNFNGTDFSAQLPVPGILTDQLKKFQPDIVHSHHPYLLGDSALRIAAKFEIPLIFTFHTLYERYTHYVPGDSPALKRFVAALSAGYANLCDYVFAPSQSIADLLRKRGVVSPITVIPTGIYVEQFGKGDRIKFRESMNIPRDAFVVGFVSRLAPEKNVMFLAHTVVSFLKEKKNAHFFVIGKGSLENDIIDCYKREGLEHRLHCLGILQHQELIDAYHSMDIFVFASQSETQGLVLAEAMAAGIPVIAIDAPGVREVVNNNTNGRLLFSEDEKSFSDALHWYANLPEEEKKVFKNAARKTAYRFSIDNCVARALCVYKSVIEKGYVYRSQEHSTWAMVIRMIKAEMDLILNKAKASGSLLKDTEKTGDFQ